MAHTIVTDICEGVADCVDACPVACIHPGEGANAKGTLLLDRFRHLHRLRHLPAGMPGGRAAILPEEKPDLQRQHFEG
jgi:NAD-dependent dihydropyrimidine dehydrogenase PreA subunit